MKALTRAGLLIFGCFAQFLWVSPAHAGYRVALVYEAAAGCPSETDFKAAVEARDGYFLGTGRPVGAHALRVSITQEAAGFRGTLQATSADATSAVREVHGATCQEVVDALAVVSATALNPEPESKPAPSAPEPPAPVPQAVPEPAPTTTTFSHGRVRATRELINAEVAVQAGKLRFDFARAITLFAGAQFGLVPNTVIPRYDLSLNAASLITTPGGNSYLHGVIPRLRVSYLGEAKYKTSDTTTELNALAFALSTCWSPIYDTRGWVALLCGEYGAGFMNIRTKDAQGNEIQDKTTGLGFVSVGAETQYNLGSLFQIGIKLGADLMVDSFSAERLDGSRIFESSRLAGYGMLGFGVHF